MLRQMIVTRSRYVLAGKAHATGAEPSVHPTDAAHSQRDHRHPRDLAVDDDIHTALDRVLCLRHGPCRHSPSLLPVGSSDAVAPMSACAGSPSRRSPRGPASACRGRSSSNSLGQHASSPPAGGTHGIRCGRLPYAFRARLGCVDPCANYDNAIVASRIADNEWRCGCRRHWLAGCGAGQRLARVRCGRRPRL